MAKVTISIPSVSWRGGRPRFTPGPETRRRYGVRGEDLKHPDGRWFSAEEAQAWVQQWRADRDKADQKARPRAALVKLRQAHLGPSLYTLAEAYFASPVITGGRQGKRETKPKAKNTVDFYRRGLKRIEDTDPELYHGPAAALRQTHCYGLYERIWQERGLATARAAMASMSVVLTWAMRAGKVPGLMVHPAKDLGMQTPEPRLRAASPSEVRQLVAASELAVYATQATGRHRLVARPEVGDMTILGVWTGQRQADRLTMTAAHLAAGRVVERQNKTKARVDFPQSPELVARIAAIKARRKGWDVEAMKLPLVVNSQTREPFAHGTTYANLFADVRRAAAAGIWRDRDGGLHIASSEAEKVIAAPAFAGWALEPMPSVADLTDQDLRDTCVTWLARAGNDPIRIAAVTGHSMVTIHAILKHYLVAHADYGDQAIAAAVAWFDQQTG